jgi:hypothetical protein
MIVVIMYDFSEIYGIIIIAQCLFYCNLLEFNPGSKYVFEFGILRLTLKLNKNNIQISIKLEVL